MARLNLSQVKASTEGKNYGESNITFTLKDDGDYALVRFLYTSPEDVTGYETHMVQVSSKSKYPSPVKCNGEGCPLCHARKPKSTKLFIVLEDLSDENKIKVWTRPAKFAAQMLELFEEYGDRLCDYTFKVKRCGAKGAKDTTYLVSAPRNNESPVDINDYTIPEIGFPVLFTKTNEDMEAYLEDGEFPKRKKDDDKEESAPRIRKPKRIPVDEEEEEEEEQEEIVPRRKTVHEMKVSNLQKVSSIDDEGDELV